MCILRIYEYSIHSVFILGWFLYIIIYFFSSFFCSAQRLYNLLIISFVKFFLLLHVQVLLVIFEAFLGVNILIHLRSATLLSDTLVTRAKSKGIPLPLICLLKLRIFSTISATFLGFLFSEISFFLNQSFNY